jgi:hypothetical protein
MHAEDEAVVTIDTLQILEGGLRRRALALVLEWAALHRDELTENWDLARRAMPLHDIDGLE